MGRRIALAILAILSVSVVGRGENRPPPEIYVGFPLLFRDASSQLFGVHGDVTFPVRPWIGIAGDAALHVGEVYAEKSLFTGMAGPVLSVNTGSRFRIFGHALLGVATSGCGDFQNGCQSATVFSRAFGGGLYFLPGNRVGFRVSADELATNFADNHQHYLRLSFGAGFKIGK